MTTRRQLLRFLAASSLATGANTFAQEPKIPRVGMLSLNSRELLEPVREGLRALGYIEGKNIHLEERAAGDRYERLAAVADEFVKLSVDVIVAGGSTATNAARRSTSTIPIVMIASADPVKAGYAVSLGRPGGNVTGLLYGDQPEIGLKLFELARELIAGATRIAILLDPDSGLAAAHRTTAQTGARELKVDVRVFEVRSGEQLPRAFDDVSRTAVQVLVVPPSSIFIAHQKRILDLAAKFKLPTIYSSASWVENGGLVSYGGDASRARREAARYIDRILRGAKPADLPIEQPKIVELAVNLKTARALGLKIPDIVLLRADKVIQ